MLQDYYKDKKTREEQKLPPLPLNVNQTEEIVKAFETNKATEKDLILIENEVPPGVDEASFIKAAFLKDIALNKVSSDLISPQHSIFLLGTMLGGYSVEVLVELLKKSDYQGDVAKALENMFLLSLIHI